MELKENEVKTIIDTLKSKIPNILAIYIFGSFADCSATDESDIDIAYLSECSLSNVERWEVSADLAAILKRDVDLVDLKSSNTIFRYQILSTGNRVYGSGYEVESFETLAYSFYLRFKQERKPIEDAIRENKTVLGS
ncbi:MAG TPA: nucleotidyltransferase domain-containing protein [Nitratifractor sp.]|nr:nucleotidyltransferase domain-containing protein [Nitratifractor sp.]